MRLDNVESDHRLPYRLFLRFVIGGRGAEPPDVMKVLCHRPELYGYPFARLLNRLLRGPSEWTVGERELIGAYTSSLNQCPF